ncbi:hypothetical protein [Allosphingosinicella sp.]|uniref:hypothetical protein n=1 Tax=Allosphingosinicella sp. TaxID=2823234 RepID=UPI00378507F4
MKNRAFSALVSGVAERLLLTMKTFDRLCHVTTGEAIEGSRCKVQALSAHAAPWFSQALA